MSNTQKVNVLNHLKSGKSITPLEALQEYGCFRLADRIFVLRKDGYNIITNNITENGKTFAEYTLLSSTLLKEKD
ncbi:hypothetical protein [uncultured Mediterranean phage uvMED]|nr:hypothetical protein [uncultured Mediterranean phage uvMED]BAQ91712.1 hypothetical protein [uncultured Mediterranean phage uvMED]BAQ91767.1 Helix-turn-helix domain [uncultured Mediterranean phage uvMED]BAQ91814.1 hypothetical protein [uncultured Mediterranean phage uvMED]BAR20460.1 hypothetical protein [uncultured Mediterranean phage uvMED]